MRRLDLPSLVLRRNRKIEKLMAGGEAYADTEFGCFSIPFNSSLFHVIASVGDGWDHVSISVDKEARCPSWEEMEHFKRMLFEPHETAMQLHVAVDRHISSHPYTLHLWRPHKVRIPLPPVSMV